MKHVKLVPELRFNEFHESWIETTLGNLANDVSYGIGSAAVKFDGENKYLRITDIDEDSNQFSPNPVTSPEGPIDSKYYLNDGDIVFARTGASVGKTYKYKQSDGVLVYAGFLIKFSINKEYNSDFIFLNFRRQFYWKWVSIYSMRSGQPGLNAEEYKAFKINLPSLPEQQKIADFLTSADRKIQALTRKVELFKAYKKGVMQKIFKQEIRFKKDDGGEFSEWRKYKVKQILHRYSDPVEVNPDKLYREIGIRSHGKGIFHKEQRTGLSLGNKRVFWVEPNLLIINIVFAWERAVAKTSSYEIGYIASHRFPMFQPDIKLLNLDYVLSYLLTPRGKALLQLASPGGAGRNKTLGQKAFEELSLFIPSLPEQIKIANFLTSIDHKISTEKQKLEKMKEWKKGLLQKMFV